MLRWPRAAPRADFPQPTAGVTIGICIGLLALVAAVFGQVVGHQFTLWDDPTYVSHNPQVLGGLTPASVWWAFSEFWASNWHPLTWLSHMLDAELWGDWPGGHHLGNVVIHGLATLLLWRFLQQTTGAVWRSAFVAALFAVHPLHVESVAWVSERKDVLAGLFWMLTLLAYRRYVARPGGGRYLLVTVSFAAGLLAKPMLVTLPIVLLLLDVWPLQRVALRTRQDMARWIRSGAVVEKLPWLALSLVSSVITLSAQQGAMVPTEALGLGGRLGLVVTAYATYLWKTVWPVSLSFFYGPPASALVLPLAVLTVAGLLALLVWAWRAGQHVLVVGGLWYLVTLVPVIGVVKVGGQAYADRYTYLPLIGIFFAIAWGLSDRWLQLAGRTARAAIALLAVAAVAGSALMAWQQTSYWRDGETLFARAIAVDPGNALAHMQYGEVLIEKGDFERGVASINRALAMSSENMVRFDSWIALGNVAFVRRQYDEAHRYYAAAGALGTGSALPDYNVGTVLLTTGRPGEAREHFLRAIRRHPRYAEAYANLGVAEERLGDAVAAVSAYEAAIRIDPRNRGARVNLERLRVRFERQGFR